LLIFILSPNLGCVFPPDQTEFIAGQVFDIRVEVQAPANGSAPFNGGVPMPEFELSIGGDGAELQEISSFYQIEDPAVESYNFTYFEDVRSFGIGGEREPEVLTLSAHLAALLQR
jgi:hypothetical protein